MALVDMYDKISSTIDKNEYAIGIFVNLSKTFDTLNHKILLAKLEEYGIRGIPLAWFTSYLSRRTQYALNNNISDKQVITSGVPKGSMLGPLLFIIYINDIVNN